MNKVTSFGGEKRKEQKVLSYEELAAFSGELGA